MISVTKMIEQSIQVSVMGAQSYRYHARMKKMGAAPRVRLARLLARYS